MAFLVCNLPASDGDEAGWYRSKECHCESEIRVRLPRFGPPARIFGVTGPRALVLGEACACCFWSWVSRANHDNRLARFESGRRENPRPSDAVLKSLRPAYRSECPKEPSCEQVL